MTRPDINDKLKPRLGAMSRGFRSTNNEVDIMAKPTKSQALAVQDSPSDNGVQTTSQSNPARLLELAISQDVDISKLEKLMELQERWDAREARKAFFDALAEFQSIMPVLAKNQIVDFTSDRGRVCYAYSNLAEIVQTIKAPLASCGLSYRFEINHIEDELEVVCVITHRDGHSERTSMRAPLDTSGRKNSVQSRGSTTTYLERYTIMGALGIATGDTDDDGRQAPAADPEKEARRERVQFEARARKAFGDVVEEMIAARYEGTHLGGLNRKQVPDLIKYLDVYEQYLEAQEAMEKACGPGDGEALFISNEPPVDSEQVIWVMTTNQLATLTNRMNDFASILGATEHFDSKIYRALLSDCMMKGQIDNLAEAGPEQMRDIHERFIKEFRDLNGAS